MLNISCGPRLFIPVSFDCFLSLCLRCSFSSCFSRQTAVFWIWDHQYKLWRVGGLDRMESDEETQHNNSNKFFKLQLISTIVHHWSCLWKTQWRILVWRCRGKNEPCCQHHCHWFVQQIIKRIQFIWHFNTLRSSSHFGRSQDSACEISVFEERQPRLVSTKTYSGSYN